jgi:Cysteine-rich domain
MRLIVRKTGAGRRTHRGPRSGRRDAPPSQKSDSAGRIGLQIALFITCVNDTLFPEAGRAIVRVLERLGHQIHFPEEQTCCGQMHANSGYEDEAMPLLTRFLRTFSPERFDAVVCPPGSCVSMIRHHYGRLAERSRNATLIGAGRGGHRRRGGGPLGRDAAQANQIVTDIVRATGASEVVKVKSIATDEIGLGPALAAGGITPHETDLAELIIQLAGDRPSHILVPAIHFNRAEIRALFRRELPGTDALTDDPGALAEAERRSCASSSCPRAS